MVDVETSIGNRFERFFAGNFPGFENHTQDKEVPDFYNPEFGFWVETKVGNIAWGVRLKADQKKRFENIHEPIVYYLGLHNFDDAKARLERRSESDRQRMLRRSMQILESYFVTSDIIQKVLDKESRLNGKKTIPYCMMKRHIFRDILRERGFRRFNVRHDSASTYYGYDKADYEMVEFDTIQKPGNLRGIILPKEDRIIRPYLESCGLII